MHGALHAALGFSHVGTQSGAGGAQLEYTCPWSGHAVNQKQPVKIAVWLYMQLRFAKLTYAEAKHASMHQAKAESPERQTEASSFDSRLKRNLENELLSPSCTLITFPSYTGISSNQVDSMKVRR